MSAAAAVCESPAASRAARTCSGVGLAAWPCGPRFGWLGINKIPGAAIPAAVAEFVQLSDQVGGIAVVISFNLNAARAGGDGYVGIGVFGFELFGKPRAVGVQSSGLVSPIVSLVQGMVILVMVVIFGSCPCFSRGAAGCDALPMN